MNLTGHKNLSRSPNGTVFVFCKTPHRIEQTEWKNSTEQLTAKELVELKTSLQKEFFFATK
jgi:hypothetical protein